MSDNYDTAVETAKEGEVGRELNQLEIKIARLTKLVSSLRNRLSPVLTSSEIPKRTGIDSPEGTPRTPHGNRLRSISFGIEESTQNIQDIISTLEV